MAITEVAIYVQRRIGDDRNFMCGRLYGTIPGLDGYDWTLWHAHSTVEGGVHKYGDSHGGIDNCLVKYLMSLPGKGMLAWRQHDEPPRNQWCIPFADFLDLATPINGGGRFRLIVPNNLRQLRFFDIPDRRLPKYELRVYQSDPRAVWSPIVTAPREPEVPATPTLQPSLF